MISSIRKLEKFKCKEILEIIWFIHDDVRGDEATAEALDSSSVGINKKDGLKLEVQIDS